MALGFVTAAIATGAGRHSSTLSHSQVELASLLTLVGLTMGALSFTLAKVAVVILLIQLLRPALWHVRFLWTLVSGNVLFMATAGLIFFLQCRPPQALWNQEVEHSCWDPMIATSLAISASGKSILVFSASEAASHLVPDTYTDFAFRRSDCGLYRLLPGILSGGCALVTRHEPEKEVGAVYSPRVWGLVRNSYFEVE